MPIGSLTAAQQQLLALTINRYVADQINKGNNLVFNQIRTATVNQIQTALNPYLNQQLTDAQANVTNLPTIQAAQTATANQLVTDIQAVIAQLA